MKNIYAIMQINSVSPALGIRGIHLLFKHTHKHTNTRRWFMR